jgi:hypothetical protein
MTSLSNLPTRIGAGAGFGGLGGWAVAILSVVVLAVAARWVATRRRR